MKLVQVEIELATGTHILGVRDEDSGELYCLVPISKDFVRGASIDEDECMETF
jgi:hypothetical protein